jgi:hypothetical protein
MDRRRNPRIEVQLPVQIWGMDAHGLPFTSPAMVSNISAEGVVLHGLGRRLRLGELLDIRMGEEPAQFRVVWIGGPGSHRLGQIGMQRVTGKTIFPVAVLSHCAQAAAVC